MGDRWSRYGKMNDDYIGIVLEGTEDDKDLFYLDNDVDGDERLNIQVRAFDEFMNDLPEHIVFVAREGSHWQTDNEYTVWVYYRPFGARYDRLVGAIRR